MKHILTTMFTIIIGVAFCLAQTSGKSKFNAVSFELGKNGFIYNLNFDHKFDTRNVGLRFGVGSNLAKYLNATVIGGGVYQLFGRTKHFLEVGADLQYLSVGEVSDDQKGFALVYPDYTIKAFYPSLNLGYRAYGEHTLFRLGFSPGLIKSDFIPGGYVSFGVRF